MSKNWNTYKTKNWVFDLFYISWEFHPCRSNHYWVREFSNFLQNDVKMAILGTQIIRSPVAWEPDHIERWLMALWDPLMTLRLGQHDFKIAWKFLWNGLFNNKVSVILKDLPKSPQKWLATFWTGIRTADPRVRSQSPFPFCHSPSPFRSTVRIFYLAPPLVSKLLIEGV